MNKKIHLFIFMILFGCLCKGQIISSKENNATASIKNLAPVELIMKDSAILKSDVVKTLVYQDAMYWGHPVFLNTLKTNILITVPTFLWQNDKNNEYKTIYLIYPGEKIYINLDKDSSLFLSIVNNMQRTNELNFFKTLVKLTGNIYNYLPNHVYHLPCRVMEELNTSEESIYNVKIQRLKFLDSVFKNSSISNAFYKIAVNTIESAALKDTLLLLRSNQDLLTNGNNLYRPLLESKLLTVSKISYQPFLVYFNMCCSLVDLLTSKNIGFVPRDSNEVNKRFLFIEHNFQDTLKDFLLTNTLYTAYNLNIPVPQECVQRFYNECNTILYKEILVKKFNQKESIKHSGKGQNLIPTNGKIMKNIQAVLSTYKDKIILLDFWASWCSPCRAEMPYSEKLKQEYNNKNVVFIYISTDDNIDDWRKAAMEENLPPSNSYLLVNSIRSDFAKQNNIQTIPRYMLIGKDGKTINADAPRPSDPKLKELLDKNL